MARRYLEAVCKPGQDVNPLFAFLQARLSLDKQGEASISMPIGMHLRQGGGMVAGGILATLADECMAHAVLSDLDCCQSAVTAEMNIRYLRSVNPEKGGELLAKARVVKKGRNLLVAEAEVFHSGGRLLATAGATFYVIAVPCDE